MLATDFEVEWDDAFAANVKAIRLLTFADVARGRKRRKSLKSKRRKKRRIKKRK
jgi:hypothetical protein